MKHSDVRRLPAPWSIRKEGESWQVSDASGQNLAFIYFEDEPTRRQVTKRLTGEEARRLAVWISRIPEMAKGWAACDGKNGVETTFEQASEGR